METTNSIVSEVAGRLKGYHQCKICQEYKSPSLFGFHLGAVYVEILQRKKYEEIDWVNSCADCIIKDCAEQKASEYPPSQTILLQIFNDEKEIVTSHIMKGTRLLPNDPPASCPEVNS